MYVNDLFHFFRNTVLERLDEIIDRQLMETPQNQSNELVELLRINNYRFLENGSTDAFEDICQFQVETIDCRKYEAKAYLSCKVGVIKIFALKIRSFYIFK